jgi:hypothetical protein
LLTFSWLLSAKSAPPSIAAFRGRALYDAAAPREAAVDEIGAIAAGQKAISGDSQINTRTRRHCVFFVPAARISAYSAGRDFRREISLPAQTGTR